MSPVEALAFLDQCAAAFLNSLPLPAREPTRQVALQAIEALKHVIEPKAAP